MAKAQIILGEMGGDISSYTPVPIAAQININESHKFMVLSIYRSGTLPTVSLNGTSVTAKATNSTSPYVYTFIIADVKSGDIVNIAAGDASICYMD